MGLADERAPVFNRKVVVIVKRHGKHFSYFSLKGAGHPKTQILALFTHLYDLFCATQKENVHAIQCNEK